MHKDLKEMLNRVHGESQHVIAISIDIRDFSLFSQKQDSVDVALFISKFYLQLIERYQKVIEDFFFKPTGDGLMICIPYDEDTLKDRFSKVIQISLDCHQDFRNMFDDLNVINFDTPSLLGIGIARGSACAIVAIDDDSQYTIDYSGHKLNLAARLQDLARPSGIIFGNFHDINLLPKDIQDRFENSEIYVRSVAENDPIRVCFLSDVVEILPENLRPLSARWITASYKLSRSRLFRTDINFRIDLKVGRILPQSLIVSLSRPAILRRDGFSGKGSIHSTLYIKNDFEFIQEGGQNHVEFLLKNIKKRNKDFINKSRVKDTFIFEVMYQLL